MSKIHKAITIIQFKIEAEIIKKNPIFNMEHRILLDKIDFERGTVHIDGVDYPLTDTKFPTIDPKNPLELTPEEREIIHKLKKSFVHSEKLQKHVKFLFAKGSMFLKYNSNLLFHGCIPVDENQEFVKVNICCKDLILTICNLLLVAKAVSVPICKPPIEVILSSPVRSCPT